MALFGKKKTPKEIMKESTRKIKKEIRQIDRQIRKTQHEQKKLKSEMKKEAYNSVGATNRYNGMRALAKGVYHAQKQITSLYSTKAKLNCFVLQLKQAQQESNLNIHQQHLLVFGWTQENHGNLNIPQDIIEIFAMYYIIEKSPNRTTKILRLLSEIERMPALQPLAQQLRKDMFAGGLTIMCDPPVEDYWSEYDDYESHMDAEIDQVKYYLIKSLFQS